MSKKHSIRWNESDSAELARRVKNFNSKVRRLEKKFSETDVIIPERVSVKQLKDLIDTRQDLNRELKSLERFTVRGSETIITVPNTDNNIQLTKWQKDEMSRRASIVNRRRNARKKAIEEQELAQGGKSLGYSRGQIGMGRADELVYKPTKAFTKKMRREDVSRKMQQLQKESMSTYWHRRDLIMRESFIKALQMNFNDKDIKDVIDAIMEMPIEDFKDTLLSNPDDFSTAYPPSDEEYEGFLNELKATWIPKPKPKKGTKKKVPKKKKPTKKKK